MSKTTVRFQPRNVKWELLPERDATPVSLDGFEDLEFRLYKMDGLWAIAEASTGLPIVRGMGTQYEAKDKTTAMLASVGPEKTRKVVADQLERIAERERRA